MTRRRNVKHLRRDVKVKLKKSSEITKAEEKNKQSEVHLMAKLVGFLFDFYRYVLI